MTGVSVLLFIRSLSGS